MDRQEILVAQQRFPFKDIHDLINRIKTEIDQDNIRSFKRFLIEEYRTNYCHGISNDFVYYSRPISSLNNQLQSIISYSKLHISKMSKERKAIEFQIKLPKCTGNLTLDLDTNLLECDIRERSSLSDEWATIIMRCEQLFIIMKQFSEIYFWEALTFFLIDDNFPCNYIQSIFSCFKVCLTNRNSECRKVDFITKLPQHLALKILKNLNTIDLVRCCCVSEEWTQLIKNCRQLKELLYEDVYVICPFIEDMLKFLHPFVLRRDNKFSQYWLMNY